VTVAGVPAVLSVLSLLWFYASVLLPLGRLLCMTWLVVAAVSLLRGRSELGERRGPAPAAGPGSSAS